MQRIEYLTSFVDAAREAGFVSLLELKAFLVIASDPGHPTDHYFSRLDCTPGIFQRVLRQLSERADSLQSKLVEIDERGSLTLTENGRLLLSNFGDAQI